MSEIELLQAALVKTKAMLTAAEQEEWSKIAELDAERAGLFHQAFPLSEENSPADVRTTLTELIELNKQVEKYCAKAKHDLQTDLSRFTRKKQAAAAYRSV